MESNWNPIGVHPENLSHPEIQIFLNNYFSIYPQELDLKLEGSGEHVLFLDLDLTLNEKQVNIKLYDKPDSFPFSIIRLPFPSSNIPS